MIYISVQSIKELPFQVDQKMGSRPKAVATDFQSIAKVATKPDPSAVDALKSELVIVVKQGSITRQEAVILKQDVSAVLASANIPASLANQTAADVKAVVVSSGITKADVKQIAGDLDAIATDLASLKT
jgi:hypothetical protein